MVQYSQKTVKLALNTRLLAEGKHFFFSIHGYITSMSPFLCECPLFFWMFIRLFPSRFWRSHSLEDSGRWQEGSSCKVSNTLGMFIVTKLSSH